MKMSQNSNAIALSKARCIVLLIILVKEANQSPQARNNSIEIYIIYNTN